MLTFTVNQPLAATGASRTRGGVLERLGAYDPEQTVAQTGLAAAQKGEPT